LHSAYPPDEARGWNNRILFAGFKSAEYDAIHLEGSVGVSMGGWEIGHCDIRGSRYGIYEIYCSDSFYHDLLPVEGSTRGIYGAKSSFMEKVYVNQGIYTIGNIWLCNSFIDVGIDQHGLELNDAHYCMVSNVRIRSCGSTLTNRDAIYVGGSSSTNNEFNNVFIHSTGSADWRYGINEIDSNQDFNIYIGVNAYNTTNGILIQGADSHCNLSWNATSWIS